MTCLDDLAGAYRHNARKPNGTLSSCRHVRSMLIAAAPASSTGRAERASSAHASKTCLTRPRRRPRGGSRSRCTRRPAVAGTTTVPRPDHVVVVVEENHSSTNILGNANAPYINSLANENANFTQSFAVTHPSQPNYLALFSGSTQGVTNDSCPTPSPPRASATS